MKRRLTLVVRAFLVVPFALMGALTLLDHGWTLWNEVRMDAAMERAEARLVELPAEDREAQIEEIVVQEITRARMPAKRAEIEAVAHRNDFAVHVDVSVPWHGLLAAVPHRSELRRTLAVQVDRT